jgi:hypothetical protein
MAFLSTHPFALIPFDEEIGLAPSDVDHQAYLHSLLVEPQPDDMLLDEDENDIALFASDESGNAVPVDENGEPV